MNCVKGKCVHDSTAKSIVGMMEAEFWKWNGAYKYIDKIICCSEFLKTKMDTNPLFATKTIAMHNFVEKVEPKDVEFYTYNVVLLRGRTGLYHRMQSGGGYWSIQSPSSLAVSASRFTCATW